MSETFSLLFGERLREVRESLGLSQAEAAARCNVTREHWGRSERGKSVLGGEVLATLAAAGADVLYILTGQRSQPVPVASTLPPRQRELLENYEATDEAGRRAIEATALLAARASASTTQQARRVVKGAADLAVQSPASSIRRKAVPSGRRLSHAALGMMDGQLKE